MFSRITQKRTIWSPVASSTCSVLGEILQIWKIHLKQSGFSHETPNAIPEGCTKKISFVLIITVCFLQVAVLQT
jgi:hypothetical protein